MERLKYIIQYHTDETPDVRVFTRKIKSGVHAIVIDFNERFCVNGYGGGDTDNGGNEESIFFSRNDDEDILFEVAFSVPQGMIIGSLNKRCYHGIYYSTEAWEELWKDLWS